MKKSNRISPGQARNYCVKSVLFEWNYNEVVHQFRHQNRQLWQPAITRLNSLEPHRVQKLQGLQDEIAIGWRELNQEQQDALLSQLELVRDTIDRWNSRTPLMRSTMRSYSAAPC